MRKLDRFQSQPKLEVRSSGFRGLGLFTLERLKPGRFILSGLDWEVLSRAGDLPEAEHHFLCQMGPDLYLYAPPGSITRYVNHSCSPNCGVRGDVDLIALEDIEEGVELTFDYSTVVASDDRFSMACLCGSSTCRGTIRHFESLPADLRRRYLDIGVVASYAELLAWRRGVIRWQIPEKH